MDNTTFDSKWHKRFAREREARKQAEKLLEEKSLALFEQNERLKHISENLEKLVKQRTQELEVALENANQANVAKRDFFANISHELRTPLNGIIGMTHLLFDTNLNNIQKDFNHTILVSSEILLNLINDILDFSKIEAGKIELEQIPFNLNQTVNEVIDILSGRLNEKGLECYLEEDNEMPINFIGDPNKLKQILINLTSNAIKFTEKGEVKIKISKLTENTTTCSIKFEIIDTGIGIDSEKIKRLFTPFTQADASTNRKFGGTGLGLSISKKLAELMQGEVGILSEPGKGSNFWFTVVFQKPFNNDKNKNTKILPFTTYKASIYEENFGLGQSIKSTLEKWGIEVQVYSDITKIKHPSKPKNHILFMGGASEEKLLAEPVISGLLNHFEYSLFLSKDKSSKTSNLIKSIGFQRIIFKPLKSAYLLEELCAVLNIDLITPITEENPESPTNYANLSHLKVLIVEDNLINQKVATAMLNKYGCIIKVAGNGVIALQYLQNEEFDLIFMDFQMPELDGYETTMRIRNGHNGLSKKDLPIIAMTANAMKGDQERCIEAGMNGFLTKPIIQKELHNTLVYWNEQLKNKK